MNLQELFTLQQIKGGMEEYSRAKQEVEEHIRDATGIQHFDPEESMTPCQILEFYDVINED